MTRIALVLSLTSLAGCGGSAPLVTRDHPSLPAVVLPVETDRGWIAGRDGDRLEVILGSLRATVTPSNGEVEWGADRFAGAIRVAAQVNGRWVFAAGDGTVAASDTFLGPLQGIGYIAPGLSRQTPSLDASSLYDRAQHVWRCDGSSVSDAGELAGLETAPPQEELPEALARALRRMAELRYPGLVLTRALARDDGAVLELDEGRLIAYDGTSGRVLGETRVAGPEGDCMLRSWGSGFAADCREPPGLWRSPDARRFDRVALAEDAIARLRLSDDGVHGAMAGPCVRDPLGHPRPALCVLDGAPPLREIAVGEDVSAIGAVRGARALVVVSGAPNDTGLRWIDLESGASQPVMYGPGITASDLVLIRYAVSLDGSAIIALVASPGGPPGRVSLAIGRGDRYDAIHPLPRGILSVAFVDALRGFAVGADLGAIFVTDDGGRRWSPIALDIRGSASAARFDLPDGLTPRIECSAFGCSIEGRVLIPFRPLGAPPREAVLAGPG